MIVARGCRTLCSLLTAVAIAGCGGDAEPDSGPGSDFVMPRDTDILIADLHWETSGLPSVGMPTNITQRFDYDNQPYFVPDGSGFWYTANDPQTGSTDIWRYDFATEMVTRVTASNPESEYSANPLPDGSGISTIRVEADSTQRLWRFDADGSNASVLLEGVAPVGYHAWIDENTVMMFVLGDPPTLQRGDLSTGEAVVIAEDIGRSLWWLPEAPGVSYVQRLTDSTAALMVHPADGGEPEEIGPTVDGLEDHAWASTSVVLMASGPMIWARSVGEESEWVAVADFTDLGISITRLAVSPDGAQIAMVAEPAPLEGFGGD